MANLIGIAANQISANGMLGTLAFQDADNVKVGSVTATTLSTATLATTGNATLGDAESSDTHAIKGATTLLANSASAALTVTQTGAGNAFVVEDSASTDSTPFVIDASGSVIQGTTTLPSGLVGPVHALVGSTAFGPQFLLSNKVADTSAGYFLFRKDRAGAIVNSGDAAGNIQFTGFDGATYHRAAEIVGAVDGTPGTNDMPGRLVFSTTADGASAPTEALRIDSKQNVGIGGAASAGQTLMISKNITGSTFASSVYSNGTIQSDVTTRASTYVSTVGTAASAFTLSTLQHYAAFQSTIGATSAVTSQYGFSADSSLTGATNNYGFFAANTAAVTAGKTAYGFYSAVNTASGGGTAWGIYAAGTAQNFFGGALTITSNQDVTSGNLIVTGSPSMNTSAIMGIVNNVTLVGGASTVQYRAFSNETTFTPAVIGGTGFGILNTTSLNNDKPVASHYQNYSRTDLGAAQLGGTITTLNQYLTVAPTINAAATTNITSYFGYRAANVTQGASQTITSVYGFVSEQAAGTNRWNFYASGTAANYFAGNTTCGAVLSAVGYLQSNSATATPAGGNNANPIVVAGTANLGIYFGSAAPTLSAAQGSLYLRSDGSSTSTRMYVNTNGSTGWAAVTTAS